MRRWIWLLAGCAVLSGCDADDDELDVSVTVDGEGVTVTWDGRAAHMVSFAEILYPSPNVVVWGVSAYEDPPPRPRREPTILPPLRYGQELNNAFVNFGPEPLVRGADYDVVVHIFGWREMCDSAPEAATSESPDCDVASGRALFTF